MTIKTEFNIGDEVFFMEDNVVATKDVTSISIYVDTDGYRIPKVDIFYKLHDASTTHGDALFGSKQELLESL